MLNFADSSNFLATLIHPELEATDRGSKMKLIDVYKAGEGVKRYQSTPCSKFPLSKRSLRNGN